MKRITLRISVILLLIPILGWSNIRAIRFSTIPGIERFEQENLFVINHLFLLEEWITEWKYKQTREEVRSRVERLFNSLACIEEENAANIDIVLYRGILAHYLYNLDATEYHEKAIEQFDRATSIAPNDYRGKWFKAVHLAKALLQDEAFELLEDIAKSIPWQNIFPYFWTDYAEVSHLSGMPCHALMGAKYAGQLLSQQDLQKYWKNATLKWILEALSKETDPEISIPRNELWGSVRQIKGQAISSYPLGILYFTKQEWQYRSSDYSDGTAAVIIKPTAYRDRRGNSVSSSIAIIINTRLDFDPEAFIAQIVPKGSIPKQVDLPIDIEAATSYEILSNAMYPQLGGAHFVITIVRRPCPETPGIALEAPIRWESIKEGQPQYLLQKQVSMRINRPIYYVFLLDIAVSVYEDALRDYIDFLNNMVVIE